jgi:glucose-6-phosphate 1-dehydrogenase
MNESQAKYVLSNRHLFFCINEIVKSGDLTVQHGILSGMIQSLEPEHYRDVMRAAVKAVYSSGDEAAADRLSRTIIRGFDYILGQARNHG